MIDKLQVDSIYTDFQKAFDTVPHWLLVKKLKELGVCPPLLDWMSDRLSEGTLRVKLGDDVFSERFLVLSGVGQGSHYYFYVS